MQIFGEQPIYWPHRHPCQSSPTRFVSFYTQKCPCIIEIVCILYTFYTFLLLGMWQITVLPDGFLIS